MCFHFLVIKPLFTELDKNSVGQTWLENKLGKSYNMVNGYVQNRQQTRLEHLYKIADVLQIDFSELLVKMKKENE